MILFSGLLLRQFPGESLADKVSVIRERARLLDGNDRRFESRSRAGEHASSVRALSRTNTAARRGAQLA